MTATHRAAARDESTSADPTLVGRVRKLLAMAEGTDNPNEADAFSRKAAELIAQYRIDADRLRDDERGDLGVVEVFVGRGAYVRGRLALLGAVGESNGCKVVYEVRPHGTVALVAGHRPDLETVELLYHSLHTQAASRMAAERRATPAATQQWRRSFLFGYADEVRSMLRRSVEEAARRVDRPESVLPALRPRDERVDEFAARQFGRIVSARPAKAPTESGWRAGREAAARADLGRRRVAGRRAIGTGR
ncbi:MAG: DUF2786 domain-containing protein [Ilumatobacteraceae bacterium]